MATGCATGCYDVWDTAWGPMAGVWGPTGLRKLWLPGFDEEELLPAEQFPRDAAPFATLREQTRAYFIGGCPTFGAILLDLPRKDTFAGAVLRACRRVAYGRTTTYGDLAAAVGRPGAARAVGGAMARNPLPLVVPCHRVLACDGRLGGFSGPGGTGMKQRMLDLESAR